MKPSRTAPPTEVTIAIRAALSELLGVFLLMSAFVVTVLVAGEGRQAVRVVLSEFQESDGGGLSSLKVDDANVEVDNSGAALHVGATSKTMLTVMFRLATTDSGTAKIEILPSGPAITAIVWVIRVGETGGDGEIVDIGGG